MPLETNRTTCGGSVRRNVNRHPAQIVVCASSFHLIFESLVNQVELPFGGCPAPTALHPSRAHKCLQDRVHSVHNASLAEMARKAPANDFEIGGSSMSRRAKNPGIQTISPKEPNSQDKTGYNIEARAAADALGDMQAASQQELQDIQDVSLGCSPVSL